MSDLTPSQVRAYSWLRTASLVLLLLCVIVQSACVAEFKPSIILSGYELPAKAGFSLIPKNVFVFNNASTAKLFSTSLSLCHISIGNTNFNGKLIGQLTSYDKTIWNFWAGMQGSQQLLWRIFVYVWGSAHMHDNGWRFSVVYKQSSNNTDSGSFVSRNNWFSQFHLGEYISPFS